MDVADTIASVFSCISKKGIQCQHASQTGTRWFVRLSPQAAPAESRQGGETFVFNFNGVRDADTFKNNASQIRRFMLEVMETAKRRDR